MSRFAPAQADLFAPDLSDPSGSQAALSPSPRDPVVELAETLTALRAAEHLPWPDAAGAMAEEHRVLGLARAAGPEGARLAACILEETERLFAQAEHGA